MNTNEYEEDHDILTLIVVVFVGLTCSKLLVFSLTLIFLSALEVECVSCFLPNVVFFACGS